MNLINIPEVAYKPINEQIMIINSNFANVCRRYPPINKELFLNETSCDDFITTFSEFDTYKLLKKYSKKSLGPEDLAL